MGVVCNVRGNFSIELDSRHIRSSVCEVGAVGYAGQCSDIRQQQRGPQQQQHTTDANSSIAAHRTADSDTTPRHTTSDESVSDYGALVIAMVEFN